MNTQFSHPDKMIPCNAFCFSIQYLFCKLPDCLGAQVKGNIFCFEFEMEICKYPIQKPDITKVKTPLAVIMHTFFVLFVFTKKLNKFLKSQKDNGCTFINGYCVWATPSVCIGFVHGQVCCLDNRFDLPPDPEVPLLISVCGFTCCVNVSVLLYP